MGPVRIVAVVLIGLVGAGCDDDTSADLGAPADLAIDLAEPDLATPDLRAPGDLARTILYDFGLFPDGFDVPLLVPHTDWVAACKMLAPCGAWDGQTLSSCIGSEQQPGHWPPLPPPVIDCLKNAGADCGAVARCMNGNNPDTTCDPVTTATACVGNAITTCDQTGVRTELDCGPYGFVCAGTTGFGCSLGACTGQGDTTCVHGLAGECSSGRVIPQDDCRMFTGASCDADGGECTGSGAPCTTDACSGNTLLACRSGHQVGFDCTLLGLTCVIPFGNPRCGLDTACSPTHVDSCNGSVLTYCDSGTLATVDCVAAGWKSCSEIGPPGCSP
jgi:hypothetical protein